MPRALWKGAISFGLVHIPIELYSAIKPSEMELSLLDRRDFSPVGFKRYNKETGEDVQWDDIVKGYEYQKDEYVVLTDDELKRANIKATQTIDIVGFVDMQDVPMTYFEQPYYLAPARGGAKVYALLRETLRRAGKVGIAKIVLRTKQHLAALASSGDMIVLNTLRYHEEIRATDEFDLPVINTKTIGISEKEMQMALSLVEGMTEKWNPKQYKDTYREDLLVLVDKKIAAHQTKTIAAPVIEKSKPESDKVIDLMALLQKSIQDKRSKAEKPKAKSASSGVSAKAETPSNSKSSAKKTASKTSSPSSRSANASSSRATTRKHGTSGRAPV